MPLRLIALDQGPDIPIDMAMLVVGRHPLCDVRLESLTVSSRHCCMSPIGSELRVEDMGSTNGTRINGYRVDGGRLRPGDELSIADIRYKLIDDQGLETTLYDPVERGDAVGAGHKAALPVVLRAGLQAGARAAGYP
jgi:pSer/pThr/pTyr-binding forkhead associated (FHA) protein